jgi:hypothetical protein
MIMKGHRLEVADVPSCCSVPFLSAGYLDGKLVEQAGRGMSPASETCGYR